MLNVATLGRGTKGYNGDSEIHFQNPDIKLGLNRRPELCITKQSWLRCGLTNYHCLRSSVSWSSMTNIRTVNSLSWRQASTLAKYQPVFSQNAIPWEILSLVIQRFNFLTAKERNLFLQSVFTPTRKVKKIWDTVNM